MTTNKYKASRTLSVILVLAIFGATSSANANIVGVEWNGTFWQIEPGNSEPIGTELGDIGPTGFNSMARGSDGTLYTILTANLPIDDAALFEIDPATSSATLLHQFTMPPEPSPFSSAGITGLAFNEANGLLYFTDSPVSDGFTNIISDLYTLDPVSGNYTLIGSLQLGAATALAFAPDGTLYSWVVDATNNLNHTGLATIDIENGLATAVHSFVGGNAGDVQSLAFDSFGNLYGVRDYLYQIDLLTGELMNGQLIEDSANIRGFEFLPVPLPGALVLMLSSGFFVGLFGRRKHVS